jgi:hypothetical protein
MLGTGLLVIISKEAIPWAWELLTEVKIRKETSVRFCFRRKRSRERSIDQALIFGNNLFLKTALFLE